MNDDDQRDSDSMLERQLEAYVRDKHFAADTLPGLTRWWLMRQRIEEEESRVKKAVMSLVNKGVITMRVLPDGTEIYTANNRIVKNERDE